MRPYGLVFVLRVGIMLCGCWFVLVRVCSTWNNWVSAAEEHEQYVDVAWRDAGDARCLRDGFGLDLVQLLTRLGRQR